MRVSILIIATQGLNRTLQLLNLTHTRLQHPRLHTIMNPALTTNPIHSCLYPFALVSAFASASMAPWDGVRWEGWRWLAALGCCCCGRPGVPGAGSEVRCERAWRERSWATSSLLSFAAFTARVVGMMRREEAKAPMASVLASPDFVLA